MNTDHAFAFTNTMLKTITTAPNQGIGRMHCFILRNEGGTK